jgi:hypothetical protein
LKSQRYMPGITGMPGDGIRWSYTQITRIQDSLFLPDVSK